MRSLLAGLVMGAMLLGAVAPVRAANGNDIDPGEEALIGLGTAVANTGYLPAKVIVAGLGLATGSVVAFLTGGDQRAAYSIWVPTASGTWILTPAHFTGERPIEFLGTDYADRPSVYEHENHGNQVYDAAYGTK